MVMKATGHGSLSEPQCGPHRGKGLSAICGLFTALCWRGTIFAYLTVP